jgi:hypothetical protein
MISHENRIAATAEVYELARKARKASRMGLPVGVYERKYSGRKRSVRRYRAMIRIHGDRIDLGHFATIEEACAAIAEAKVAIRRDQKETAS